MKVLVVKSAWITVKMSLVILAAFAWRLLPRILLYYHRKHCPWVYDLEYLFSLYVKGKSVRFRFGGNETPPLYCSATVINIFAAKNLKFVIFEKNVILKKRRIARDCVEASG